MSSNDEFQDLVSSLPITDNRYESLIEAVRDITDDAYFDEQVAITILPLPDKLGYVVSLSGSESNAPMAKAAATSAVDALSYAHGKLVAKLAEIVKELAEGEREL